jgi:hypothetical protein
MAKKDAPKKAELIPEDADVEERVRQMMDPSVKEPAPSTDAAPAEPATAPEITDLPKPDRPLKIKILHDDDVQTPEPPSAPELSDTSGPKKSADDKVLRIDDVLPEAEEPTTPPPDEAPRQPEAKAKERDEPEELPEDSATAAAVDDIVRRESDQLLQAEDEKRGTAPKPSAKKSGHKPKRGLFGFLKNSTMLKTILIVLVLTIAVAGVVPTGRYFVLNAAGVRASASVHVVDQSTLQPLKNVEFSLGGVSARTDKDGNAKVEKVKLGPATMHLKRRAFAPVERKVTIGWGSNPLGEEKLKPTGSQYAFVVSDFLTGKPIAKAEATTGEASALSDEQGKLVLTMVDPADELTVTITSPGRRTEKIKLNPDIKAETKVRMVPARRHAYISKRDGRYDVFAVYADGKQPTLVLAGTGRESEDMVLVPHSSEEVAALVSTRDGKRNKDGNLLSNLTVVNLQTKTTKTIQSSERIQVIGWQGDRLVYVRVVSGVGADHPKRNRLMAYHYRDDTDNELAASNYFNDVLAATGLIYYAPSKAYQKEADVGLFSIRPDGSDRKVVLGKEVWNLFRTDYNHIALSAPPEWYNYRIGDEAPGVVASEPADLTSRVFTTSPNEQRSLWVDTQGGKGVLLVHDAKSGEDKTLHSQTGLKNPLAWLDDNTAVYRIKSDTEVADYVLSLAGGKPHKIADVTNTDGIDRWYYY